MILSCLADSAPIHVFLGVYFTSGLRNIFSRLLAAFPHQRNNKFYLVKIALYQSKGNFLYNPLQSKGNFLFNPLQNDKIPDVTKQKAFADEILKKRY